MMAIVLMAMQAQGEVACVRLEDESGKLFAVCKVDSNEQGTPAVEPVLDSSRCVGDVSFENSPALLRVCSPHAYGQVLRDHASE